MPQVYSTSGKNHHYYNITIKSGILIAKLFPQKIITLNLIFQKWNI